MEGKVVTGILAAAGLALLGASVVVLGNQDKTPPVIKVGETKLSYTEGESFDGLLADVSAEDNKDANVTDKVFVERIIHRDDATEATVVYAVVDESKNVATAERVVDYIAKDETEDKIEEQDEPEQKTEESQGEKPAEEPQEVEPGELKPNGTSPAIRLKTDKTVIKIGGRFDALSYVENVIDDSDDRNTLYQHIHVDGNYNTNKAGTYKLRYYVTDSRGNASNIIEFTLVVE